MISKFEQLHRARRAHRGFTIIELLVVIGILLILIGLFTGGVMHVTAQARQKDTRTNLELAKTLLQNYQQATSFSKPPPTVTPISGASISAFTISPVMTPTTTFWTSGQELAPGWDSNPPVSIVVSPDNLDLSDVKHPALPTAVANTEVVMQAMLTVSENKNLVNLLPSGKRIVDAATNVPLLLDGWGNVILFVPPNGISGVYVSPATTGVTAASIMTSTGAKASSWTATTPNFNKCFFVSAGPDGDISNSHGDAQNSVSTTAKDDDNLYSFQ